MWNKDQSFSGRHVIDARCTSGHLLDLSQYLQPPTSLSSSSSSSSVASTTNITPHWNDLPNTIKMERDIVGLCFGNDINNYSKRIKNSWFGNGGYHEHTSRSLLHYVASLYRNSDMATCESLKEAWIPLPASPKEHPEDAKYDYTDLFTIFTYAKYVRFFQIHDNSTDPAAEKYIEEILLKAYKKSRSMANIICRLKNDGYNIPFVPTNYESTEHPWKSQQIILAAPYQGFKQNPWYHSLNPHNKQGVTRFYRFLYNNPQPGIVASDFDGTIYREDHKAVGINGISYTHYLSVHCAFIVRLAKEYLRKYPDTFPAFQPTWTRDDSNPASVDKWFQEYTRNILFTEFLQERRLNDPRLTGGRPISPDEIGATPPITRRFLQVEKDVQPRNATMAETCDMLATIWNGRRAEGPPPAYEEVFNNSPELRGGIYTPVAAMLNDATNMFHNKTAVITLAFPDFVRWFLGKHDLFLPVIGNRAEESDNIFTDTRDISYFHKVPSFHEFRENFAVDEKGKAQILEHYFKDCGLKPKVFFGNSDGDYEAAKYTLEQNGMAVLINPRGERLLELTKPDYYYSNRVVVLNLDSSCYC